MSSTTLDNVEEVVGATAKAVLVRFKNRNETWVPRSVCEDGDDLAVGDTDIVVQDWFIEREGLN